MYIAKGYYTHGHHMLSMLAFLTHSLTRSHTHSHTYQLQQVVEHMVTMITKAQNSFVHNSQQTIS